MADDITIALIGIIITACLTVLGWNMTHFLQQRREIQIRVLEMNLKRIERQIEEFYGPLYSSVNQLAVIWDTEERLKTILESDEQRAKYKIVENNTGKIEEYLREKHYFPLYNQIRELFTTRLYLLEDAEIPPSFQEYLDYSTQEYIQHQLWRERSIPTDYLHGLEWPDNFEAETKQALKNIMEIYRTTLKSIQRLKSGKMKKVSINRRFFRARS